MELKKELQALRRDYEYLLEHAGDVVTIWQAPPGLRTDLATQEQLDRLYQSRLIHANRVYWEGLLGLSSAESIIGRPYLEIVAERSVDAELREFITNGFELHRREVRQVLPGGETTYSLDTWHGLVEHGELKRLFAVATLITDQKRLEHELERHQDELRNANLMLEQKNAALRELLGQLRGEKERMATDIESSVVRLIHPVIDQLAQQIRPTAAPLLALLRQKLDELTSSRSAKLAIRLHALSRRELEICNLIKAEHSTPEIATLLGISPSSVSNHRFRIRSKLGLNKRKTPLSEFLSVATPPGPDPPR
jgi:DNA-binding CsgD family transcriptional regulator